MAFDRDEVGMIYSDVLGEFMTLATRNQTCSARVSVTTRSETNNETKQIKIQLTRKLSSFVRPRHLKMIDRFDRFQFIGLHHIHAHLGRTSEAHAFESLCKAARTIRFMDRTGLLPTSEEIYGFNTFSPQHRLPGQDHATTWRDPETNVIVLLDEPRGYVDTLFDDRDDWAAHHGFAVRRLNYAGTYRPGCGLVCDLVYRVEQKSFVQKIIERIEKLDLLPEIEDSWRANLDV